MAGKRTALVKTQRLGFNKIRKMNKLRKLSRILQISTLLFIVYSENAEGGHPRKNKVLDYGGRLIKHGKGAEYNTSFSYRSGRYLFPFAVVNFPPEPCSPTNTQQMDGVCLSKKRCTTSTGETVGSCQQGLGTCCKFTKQCFAKRRSVTVLETVENLMSSNMAGSCEYVFPKQQGICQIKLEFTNVMLQEAYLTGPNAGNCQSESLTVVGAANLNGPLKVCGRLSGQHMILSYGATSDLISVVVHSELLSAIYSIRATQIPCTSPYKAPDDCLQYFTSTTSSIKSFGFPRQLNNQRYTICVKPNSGGTTLSWDRCTDTDSDGIMKEDRFKVSEQSKPCLTDWLAIDAEKRCGQTFTPMMTAMGSHARVRVNFDENELGDDLFTVALPSLSQNSMAECQDQVMFRDVVYQGQVTPSTRLCNYTSTNICQCKFQNMPNMAAQAFVLQTPNNQPGYICPKIKGHTASPEKTDSTSCMYFANIRITDTNNTGFCLRYQAM